MQNNSTPAGSMIEPNAVQPFAPSAPGSAPMNTGAQLTSDGAAKLNPPAEPKKTHNTLIETVLLVITSIIAVVFIWLYVQKYIEWNAINTDLDSRVNAQVAIKVAENTTEMEAQFEEREKFPYRNFSGPVDYGSFSFEYPKTWSVYIAKDAANGGDFEAYLNPVEVPPVGNSSIMALRVKIRDTSFESVAKTYESSIKNGKVTLKNQEVGGVLANIYTGELSKNIKGIAMILKLRDKTVLVQTDAMDFENEFYRILESVSLVE